MPGSSLGTAVAPVIEHSASARRVASTAWAPPLSEFNQKLARLRRTFMPPLDHPAGSVAMHGTEVADGTAWAMRIISLLVPQSGDASSRALYEGVSNPPMMLKVSHTATTSTRVSPTRLTFQR